MVSVVVDINLQQYQSVNQNEFVWLGSAIARGYPIAMAP